MAKQFEDMNKMERYMALNPGLSKLKACQKREAMWERYFDTGVHGVTDITRDQWVSDKLHSEGWFDK